MPCVLKHPEAKPEKRPQRGGRLRRRAGIFLEGVESGKSGEYSRNHELIVEDCGGILSVIRTRFLYAKARKKELHHQTMKGQGKPRTAWLCEASSLVKKKKGEGGRSAR